MRNLLLILTVALLFGCGGSDSGGTKPRDLSAFVGTWEGAYQERGGDRHSGTVRIMLARGVSNVFYAGGTGTLVDSARGEGNADVGLTNEGDLTITYGFGVDLGMYNYTGVPRIDSRGHLVAPMAYSIGDEELINDIDLAPVAP